MSKEITTEMMEKKMDELWYELSQRDIPDSVWEAIEKRNGFKYGRIEG